MAEIAVDLNGLRAASGEVRTAAELLSRTFDGRAGELAVYAPTAWSMVRMMGTATGAWGPYLGQVRDSVAGSADQLSAIAAHFEATEWEAARHQRRGGAFGA